MSWFRTYRPTSVSGLHLTKVREQLEDLFKRGQMPQVWLLTGPKGTGKTSTARIIAAMLNLPLNADVVKYLFFKGKKPKNTTLHDPDPSDPEQRLILQGQSYIVQEWDAASHRGIDEIRALKEQVALPPQMGLMSVYILDEVHMLTTEAFNALLKLLEEPPEHVVFMLATTERHKVPETIVSRATLLTFTQATSAEIRTALESILKQEKITYDAPALERVAQVANGSFRDAVKFLEQVANGRTHLDEAAVAALGSSLDQEVQHLISAVTAKDPHQVVEIFGKWRAAQRDPDFVYRQVLTWLHDQILQELGVKPGTASIKQTVALFLLSELQVLPGWSTTPIPLLPLEVKLLEVISRAQAKRTTAPTSSTPPASTPSSRPSNSTVSAAPVDNKEELIMAAPIADPEPQVVANATVATSLNLDPVALGTAQILLEQWETYLDLVQAKNSTIAAVLRSAKPLETSTNHAKIAVFYKFHYEQLKQPKFLKILEDSALPLTGGLTQLDFILQEHTSPADPHDSLTSLAGEVLV